MPYTNPCFHSISTDILADLEKKYYIKKMLKYSQIQQW